MGGHGETRRERASVFLWARKRLMESSGGTDAALMISFSVNWIAMRRVPMKYIRMFCLLAILSLAVGAVSQGQGAAPAAKPATPAPQAQASPQPAQPPPTFASMADRQVSASEKQLVEAAEAMPEDKYNFTPESLNI